jgi:AraC-like DNA-binding protein
MMFHLCIEGHASVVVSGETIQLNAGDFVLLPKGEGHILFDGNCQTVTPLSALPIKAVTARYETLDFGGNGATSLMICSALLFDHPLAIKLLGVLPPHIIIRQDDSDVYRMITNLCPLLKTESKSIDMGAEAVISKLADLIVITALRAHLSQLNEEATGWLNALEDERIGKSIDLLHKSPDKHWRLEELASQVGMSRTSFAQQFKRLIGDTPMDYLTEWRMSLAFSQLQHSDTSILSIALEVGYQSESSFSRAFKKIIGKTPGDVRRAMMM